MSSALLAWLVFFHNLPGRSSSHRLFFLRWINFANPPNRIANTKYRNSISFKSSSCIWRSFSVHLENNHSSQEVVGRNLVSICAQSMEMIQIGIGMLPSISSSKATSCIVACVCSFYSSVRTEIALNTCIRFERLSSAVAYNHACNA